MPAWLGIVLFFGVHFVLAGIVFYYLRQSARRIDKALKEYRNAKGTH